MSALKIKNLTVRKKLDEDGGRPFVDGISLDLKKGKIHFLVGPNGCGKSTIVRAIMHLLDRDIYDVTGQISVNGGKIWDKNKCCLSAPSLRAFLLKNVGFIPQNPVGALDQTMKIADALKEKKEMFGSLGLAGKDLHEDIFRVLGYEEAEKQDLLSRFPGELSGGQQQMANIALSLYGRPGLIIADEGFDYLDFDKIEKVLKYLLNSVLNDGATMLMICHDYQLIFQVESLFRKISEKNSDDVLRHVEMHQLEKGHENKMRESFQRTIIRLRNRMKNLLSIPMNSDANIILKPFKYKYHVSGAGDGSAFELSLKEKIEFPKRSFVGLIGESGSGKTTLARLIAGVIKDRKKREITGLPDPGTALQYTYQVPYPCFNRVKSPWHMLLEGRNSLDNDAMQKIFEKLNWNNWPARKMEAEKLTSNVFLSGGELQKICLCRPLLWNPEVLILDEPFSNLDPDSHQGLLEIIERTSDATRILILHDIYLALGICSYIIFLKQGKVEFAGPTDTLLEFLESKRKFNFSREMSAYLEKIRINLGSIGHDFK